MSVLSQFDMTGKVCIVTGASRGIGYAVAEGLAEASASLVMVYTSNHPEMDEKAASLARRRQVKVWNWRCDVTNAARVQNLASSLREVFGKIDVFVANAGSAPQS